MFIELLLVPTEPPSGWIKGIQARISALTANQLLEVWVNAMGLELEVADCEHSRAAPVGQRTRDPECPLCQDEIAEAEGVRGHLFNAVSLLREYAGGSRRSSLFVYTLGEATILVCASEDSCSATYEKMELLAAFTDLIFETSVKELVRGAFPYTPAELLARFGGGDESLAAHAEQA